MFRFEHAHFVFGLVIILGLAGLYYVLRRQRNSVLNQFASSGLWSSLIPSLDDKLNKRRIILWLSALALIVIALSNPQWGIRKEKIEIKSTDIYVALDISNSMACTDIKPNRLERAKLWTESFLRSLADDRVGMVFFAGHAFLQSPLTTDYGSSTMFARSADPTLITTQGTNISDAITTCMDNFPKNEEAQKVILLLTDGEDHDDQAMAAANKAKQQNIAIYTIGVGTAEGGLIPVRAQGMEDYKRDETGKPIQTKLNPTFLTQLAESTQGKYYSITQGDAIIESIKADVANMTKQRVAERAYSDYESYFPYFLFPAIILLVLEYLISIKWMKKYFNRNPQTLG